jgi:PIN domain nuclease of toxin-antitoxin system
LKLLLDTQVFLWLQTEPERLGDQLQQVEDRTNELLLSAASSWEIAIKHALGKLVLPQPPAEYVPKRVAAIGAVPLPIEHGHALSVSALEPIHRDPFDRLLIAQAAALGLTLLTADAVLARYEVPCVLVGRG